MKLLKRFGHNTLDRFMNKGKEVEAPKQESKTYLEERQEAERKAVAHEMKRKAQSEKLKDLPAQEFAGAFKDEISDREKVIEGASKALKAHINDLIGKGGYDIGLNEFRSRKSHRDIADDSEVTEQAFISFAVNFALPGHNKYKTAKFVVSYADSADEPYNVEDNFYDNNDSEYVLTSSNLENYLSAEQNMENEKTDKPLAMYNPEFQTYEIVETAEDTDKVVARLRSNGYEVKREYIDACYDPKQFGRLCYVAQVPLGKDKEFKKMAAMSDDDWTSRSHEKSWTQKEQEWNDRALEKEGDYGKMALDKDETWFDRSSEKAGHGNYGNPYPDQKTLLSVDSMKKNEKKDNRREAVKKALTERQSVEKESLSALEQLEKIMKND